jgi:hypothetical protein
VKGIGQLLPLQRGDFLGIFREMAGYPVTIRRWIRHCTKAS